MTATRVHLVRHGEVENPGGIVYGRMSGFHLSERGRRQADAAAHWMRAQNADVRRVISSPLERAQESAEAFTAVFGGGVDVVPGVTEAINKLEGKPYDVSLEILRHPQAWRFLVNPMRPSWGEPYRAVLERMLREIAVAAASVDGGDVVIVSHQMPIWVTARHALGKRSFHDPRRRQCAHSSITTVRIGSRLGWESYADPAAEIL